MVTVAQSPTPVSIPQESVLPTVATQESLKPDSASPEAGAAALPGRTVETIDLKGINKPEDISNALKDASKIMLFLKDPHLLLLAQANQCGDTPMGLEFQYDVLQSVRQMSIREGSFLKKSFDKLALYGLQQKLGKLQYPEKPPTEAFEKFLVDNKDKFPEGSEPTRIALELNTGKMHVADLVKIFQGNKDLPALQEPFYKALMGDKPHDIGTMLTGVGINIKKNKAAINEMLTGNIGQHGGFDRTLAVGIGFLALTTVIQMMQQDAQPQRGMAHG